MTDATLRQLAAAAHQCWCDRMKSDGWRAGPEFSSDGHVHDAILPFDALSKPDQRRTLRALRCEDAMTFLARLLEYPRGAPGLPELQPEDMRIGREVEFVPELRPGPGAARRGRIVSWVINDSTGDLDLVHVRWDDGTETEHTPPECELMLAASSGPAA